MTHLLDQPLPELLTALATGSTTATALVEESLRRVTAHRELQALLTVDEVGARTTAARVDQARAEGRPLGKLAGVPIAIKDALLTRGWPTTAASKILVRSQTGVPSRDPQDGWRPPYDATAVARLRAADAVIIGKANMDEFAMGSSNENSAFAPARNPWATDRTPGGSSGGSAVSVAAGLAPLSLGSDTGGSIRQPASLCGVVGVKPTYGRVSRYGLIAFASSLDQIGPFARDVRSAAALLEVIAGVDDHDSTSSAVPVPNYLEACGRDVRGLRVGVPAEYFGAGIDAAVEASVREAIEGLRQLGCTVHPVQLPHTRFGVATYYILATAEASSNLARFDGVRFGLRTERPGASLAELYGDTRDGGFGPEVKRRILLGTYVLSAGYYDAYYRKAQKVRTLISRDFDRAFQEVDLIATPCSPVPAFRLGERIADPLAMYLADIFTLPASLAGIPGLSVPCRPTPATADRPSLPVGLQLLAPHFHEERMFQAAAAWESISPARLLRPDGY